MVYAIALTVNFEQGRSIVTADSLQFLHFQAGVNRLQFLDDSHAKIVFSSTLKLLFEIFNVATYKILVFTY
jgi:hypothetical protein